MSFFYENNNNNIIIIIISKNNNNSSILFIRSYATNHIYTIWCKLKRTYVYMSKQTDTTSILVQSYFVNTFLTDTYISAF